MLLLPRTDAITLTLKLARVFPAVHLGQVVKATQPPRKVEVGTCGFEFNVGRTCIACIRSTRPFRETVPIHAAFGSWDQWTKGKNAGPSGGSGGGGGDGARAPGKVGAAGGIKNEDGEIIFPEDDDMMGKPVKVRAALFDRETYYPTVIPFKHVDQPHDPNVATDAGLPVDLSTQVLPQPPHPCLFSSYWRRAVLLHSDKVQCDAVIVAVE